MSEITWSTVSGGEATEEPLDLGTVNANTTGSGTTVFLRHGFTNKITNTKIYLAPYTNDYEGVSTPSTDLSDILELGSAGVGLQVNFNATGGFPAGDWQSLTSASGGSLSTALILPATTGADASGEIAADNSEVRFQLRVKMPTTYTGLVGDRQVELRVRFTYTS